MENLGFDISIADHTLLAELSMFFEVVLWKKFSQNIFRLGIRNGALFDELVAPLRIRASDVARHSENGFALVNGVRSGIKRTRLLSRLDHHYDI